MRGTCNFFLEAFQFSALASGALAGAGSIIFQMRVEVAVNVTLPLQPHSLTVSLCLRTDTRTLTHPMTHTKLTMSLCTDTLTLTHPQTHS